MSINNNYFNESSQVYFMGLDVHKKKWTVCIRNSGLFQRKFSMNPSAVDLYNHLRKNYPGGIYNSVYEAGYCGYWIDRELKKLGINNIIVSPSGWINNKEYQNYCDRLEIVNKEQKKIPSKRIKLKIK